MNYQMGGFNWVRFGSFGKSIFLITAATADHFYGFKWRDNSRRWTNRVKVLRSAVLGALTSAELDGAPAIRAIDAMPEQLSAKPEVGPPVFPTDPPPVLPNYVGHLKSAKGGR